MIPSAFLLRHRRTVALLYLLLVLASLPGIWSLRLDNSPEVFFVGGEGGSRGEIDRYHRFRERFGSDDTLRIVFSGPRLWSREGLAWLGRVEGLVAELEGVESAVGLRSLHGWHLLDWPPPDPGAFRERILQPHERGLEDAPRESLDLAGGWVAPDGGRAALLIVLGAPSGAEGKGETARKRLLATLDQLVEGAPAGVSAQLTGLAVVERALDRSLLRMARRFFPFLALLVVALLAVTLRRAAAVAVPLLFVVASMAPVLGAMGYAGARLNVVTVILLPLLFVIGLALGIHVLLRFRRHARGGSSAATGEASNTVGAVLATYREEGWAVFWTGVSTLIGFGSLMTSAAAPIRSLGLWSAVGLGFMTLTAFVLYPVLLAAMGRVGNAPGDGTRSRGAVWGGVSAAWAVEHRWAVYAGAGVLALGAVAGTPWLRVESSALGYLPAEHPVRVGLEEVQDGGLGAVTLELVLEREAPEAGDGGPERPGFRDPAGLDKLARLSDELRSLPGVSAALGAGDLVQEAVRRTVVGGEVDDNLRWLVLGLLETDPEGRRLLSALAPPGGEAARISLLIPMLDFTELEPLAEEVEARAEGVFPGAEARVTGRYFLVVEGQRTLLTSLITSLGLTLASIGTMFWLLLGSLRSGLRMLVPNLLPPLFVLGLMGWVGVPLDSSTVIIAAVVLGLVVDDTLHSLGHFRRLAPRLGAREAAVVTLERTAPAHLLTSSILIAGFGVCGLSELVPIARFGALAAAAVLVALVADLLLVPALLSSFYCNTSKVNK